MLLRELLYTKRNLLWLGVLAVVTTASILAPLVSESAQVLDGGVAPINGGFVALMLALTVWPLLNERMYVDFETGSGVTLLRRSSTT